MNRTFNLLEMIGKRGFQKIGRSIMGCRKYLALERRRQPRYPITIDVEFYVWDKVTKKPLTAKVTGRLVNISGKGARLQTNTVRIGSHHLVVSGGLEGESALILEFPTSSEGIPWILKAQILWYNAIYAEFKFEFGIGFVDISPSQQKCLESVIKSI
jgi:PilZ domain